MSQRRALLSHWDCLPSFLLFIISPNTHGFHKRRSALFLLISISHYCPLLPAPNMNSPNCTISLKIFKTKAIVPSLEFVTVASCCSGLLRYSLSLGLSSPGSNAPPNLISFLTKASTYFSLQGLNFGNLFTLSSGAHIRSVLGKILYWSLNCLYTFWN
jgi:hypothetical protein